MEHSSASNAVWLNEISGYLEKSTCDCSDLYDVKLNTWKYLHIPSSKAETSNGL